MVDLGQGSSYAVLSGASVGNTVSAAGAPHTTLRGDLGVQANAQPTGFSPPGVVTGVVNVGVGGRGSDALIEAVRALDAAAVETRDLALRRPSLDDVFLALTGHAAEEEDQPTGRRRGRRGGRGSSKEMERTAS